MLDIEITKTNTKLYTTDVSCPDEPWGISIPSIGNLFANKWELFDFAQEVESSAVHLALQWTGVL